MPNIGLVKHFCYQSINQSKHISIAPYVASESEALSSSICYTFASLDHIGIPLIFVIDKGTYNSPNF